MKGLIITNYLNTKLESKDINKFSTLALAYIGDAVYELCTRIHVFELGNYHSLEMHKSSVGYVNARAQAAACDKILPLLSDEEKDFFKRGRNSKVNSVPKGASQSEYHSATGLETLFGYLYLSNQIDRINQLYSVIVDEN